MAPLKFPATLGGDFSGTVAEVGNGVTGFKKGGIIVSMLEQPRQDLMKQYGVNAIAEFTQVSSERLAELSRLVDKGAIKVHVDKTFPPERTAEWTHHVSYSPGMIAVCVGHGKATNENIKATKEFGVSIAADNQNVLASVAGGSSGKNVDKIAVLKELGFKFYKAKKISVLMVEGAALNAECKAVHVAEFGDHTMFVGEVLEAKISAKEPIIYHGNKYFKVGERVEKPQAEELESIKKVVEKFRKV